MIKRKLSSSDKFEDLAYEKMRKGKAQAMPMPN